MAANVPNQNQQGSPSDHGWREVWMLVIIMVSLGAVFLGGLGIITTATNFESADVVAILSPALAAIGTVAAGVFGYSLGTRGAGAAQDKAVDEARKAGAAGQQAAQQVAATVPLVREVKRVVEAARKGDAAQAPDAPNHRLVSVDDLDELIEDANVAESAQQIT